MRARDLIARLACQVMNGTNRSIYRADAVRRYLEGREQTVLPRFVSPRSALYLWILLALLLASGGVTWLVRVPIYASGQAVVVRSARLGNAGPGDVVLVAFLPPQERSQLHVGQPLFVHQEVSDARSSMPIVAVEPGISSPDAARKRFALDGQTAGAITGPATVVIAAFEPADPGLPASLYDGTVYPVDVEVGSRRVIALFPILDQVFGE